MPGGEIDLLAEDAAGALVVIEVRGRARHAFLPRHTLSPGKIARVRRMGERIGWRYRRQVRLEFLEVVGELPQSRWVTWLLGWWPELFGIKLTAFELGV